MNKTMRCVCTLGVIIAILLTSCGQTPATTTPTTTNPTTKPTTTPTTKPTTSPTSAKPTSTGTTWDNIIAKETLQSRLYGNATEGGSGYVRVGGFAQIITKYTTIRAALTVSAGLPQAGPQFNKGTIDFTDISPTQPLTIYRGETTENHEKVRLRLAANGGGIASVYGGIFTTAKNPVKLFTELKGKKIGYNPGTTWSVPWINACIKANNMSEKDVTMIPGDTSALPGWLLEGRVDAIITVLGTGTLQIATEAGLNMLATTPAEQTEIAAVTAMYAGMIPKGYQGCPDNIPGMNSPLALWLRAGLNNITAYTFTKTFWDHIDEFYVLQDKCAGYTLDYNLNLFCVPWHPGAIKYYQELGLWTAEHSKRNMEAIEAERVLYGGEVPDIEMFKLLGVVK